MATNNAKNIQTILTKLDIVIAINQDIVSENKQLINLNNDLSDNNKILTEKVTNLDIKIEELNEKVNSLLQNIDNIQKSTININDKVIGISQDNTKNDLVKSNENHTPQKHSLIITTNDETEFSQAKWSDIASQKLSKVQINKISLTKKGQCYINFPNKQNQDQAIKCLKDDFTIKAQTKNVGIMPKITIFDLNPDKYNSTTKDILKKDILLKNPKISELVYNGKTFDIIFIKESYQGNNQAVIKIDPEILNLLNNIKKTRKTNAIIYINNTACRFYNRFHIVQCYQCQSFGHRKGSPSCPLFSTNQNTCLYCSMNHPSKDCIYKKEPEKFKCANCTRFSCVEDNNININHATTDQECPLFQKQIDQVLKNTIGVDKNSKNDYAKHVFIT